MSRPLAPYRSSPSPREIRVLYQTLAIFIIFVLASRLNCCHTVGGRPVPCPAEVRYARGRYSYLLA